MFALKHLNTYMQCSVTLQGTDSHYREAHMIILIFILVSFLCRRWSPNSSAL